MKNAFVQDVCTCVYTALKPKRSFVQNLRVYYVVFPLAGFFPGARKLADATQAACVVV